MLACVVGRMRSPHSNVLNQCYITPGMAEELETCAAAYFRGIGKDTTTPDEFVIGTSLNLKWMPPSETKLLLAALTDAGVVLQRDGYVRPAGDLSTVDVPLAYRPSRELVESLRGGKSQKPNLKETPGAAGEPADIFPMLMSKAVESGMDRRDFIQSCNRMQKRLDIEIGVAAFIVLRDAGTDVSPYFGAVYDSVRAA